MFVKILTTALILSYAAFGVDVGCCDSCGNLWDQEFMTLTAYANEMHFGELCPVCVEFWNVKG